MFQSFPFKYGLDVDEQHSVKVIFGILELMDSWMKKNVVDHFHSLGVVKFRVKFLTVFYLTSPT